MERLLTDVTAILVVEESDGQPVVRWRGPIELNFDGDLEGYHEMTDDEFSRKVIHDNQITFTEESSPYNDGYSRTFNHPGGFTIRQILDCVLEFETVARARSHWFGCIDTHHVFFEGIRRKNNGAYEIEWGS